MGYEPLCTTKESAIQNAAEQPRNKAVLSAYNTIEVRIAHLIEGDFNRAWDKFPRFEKDDIKESNVIKSVYTAYCSLKLVLRAMNYIIILTTSEQSFNAGHGAKSTQLLREAFDTTRYEREGFMVQNALEIRVDNNIEAIYKQKVDERIDQMNLKYFNQKMKIEGWNMPLVF